MTAKATISWEDNQDVLCYGADCTEDTCPKYHPDTDILPDRFAFWMIGDKKATYQPMDRIRTVWVELEDMDKAEPFRPGDAIIKDLDTKEQMDVAEFMATKR